MFLLLSAVSPSWAAHMLVSPILLYQLPFLHHFRTKLVNPMELYPHLIDLLQLLNR
jgi:hypothetical protein